MHANPSKTVALIVVALVVALPGLIGGCGAGSDESTSTTVTSVPASTTLTTAASTTTTAATTTTTVAPTTTSIAATTTTRPTGLPTLAEVEGYRQWLKMNVEPIQGRTHGLTDIYINQDRETIAPNGTLTFPFPDGTVIVKEGSLIAIMRKVTGIDSNHADWQWIEYREDGRVVGKDSSCWSCHVQAESTDWVFTVLEIP